MFDIVRGMGRDVGRSVDLLRQINEQLATMNQILIVGFSSVVVLIVVTAVVRRGR